LPLPYRWQVRVERWKSLFRGSGPQQPRPKLCPSCGALVGISATRCHECGTSLRFSMAAASKHLSGVFSGPAPVTSLILVANILMFGVTWLATIRAGGKGGFSILWGANVEALYRLGMVWKPAIEEGEWYRLVTAMFLHGGLLHIGMNMMSLMNLAPALEELYGSARFLFLYVFTGAFGFLVSAFNPFTTHPTVGASGALLGLVGAMIAVTTRRGGAYMRALRSQLISSVVILLLVGIAIPIVDNWAHGGGFVAGFVLGKIFADREPLNPRERNVAYLLGWIAGLAVIASFAFMILRYNQPLQ